MRLIIPIGQETRHEWLVNTSSEGRVVYYALVIIFYKVLVKTDLLVKMVLVDDFVSYRAPTR